MSEFKKLICYPYDKKEIFETLTSINQMIESCWKFSDFDSYFNNDFNLYTDTEKMLTANKIDKDFFMDTAHKLELLRMLLLNEIISWKNFDAELKQELDRVEQ